MDLLLLILGIPNFVTQLPKKPMLGSPGTTWGPQKWLAENISPFQSNKDGFFVGFLFQYPPEN